MQHHCIKTFPLRTPGRIAQRERMELAVLLTSFGLIFIAELPDKTAYTVLLLAARSRTLPVLLGSWAAFVVQSLIAVALGSLLMRLPAEAVRWSAAALMFLCGLLLLLRKEPPREPEPMVGKRALATAFGLVFLAEIGDATQLATAALVARFQSPWSVFVGATLALWSVAALAVAVGKALRSRLPRRALRTIAGALFCAFAVATVLFR
jgi:putative Ca2+/H+ antiporter (TMEM165/GDT1 family)